MAALWAVLRASADNRSKTKAMTWGLVSGAGTAAGAAAAATAAGAAGTVGAFVTLGSGFSSGRPKTWNDSTRCLTPSSNTSKSDAWRSRTALPFLSRTTTSSVTAEVPTPKVGISGLVWAAGACGPATPSAGARASE